MNCYQCKYRDDESKSIDECCGRLQILAMNGLSRGDFELVKHILWELELLHREIKRNLNKREKDNGPKDLSI